MAIIHLKLNFCILNKEIEKFTYLLYKNRKHESKFTCIYDKVIQK